MSEMEAEDVRRIKSMKNMYDSKRVVKREMDGGSSERYLCQRQPQLMENGWACHGGAGNAKTELLPWSARSAL